MKKLWKDCHRKTHYNAKMYKNKIIWFLTRAKLVQCQWFFFMLVQLFTVLVFQWQGFFFGFTFFFNFQILFSMPNIKVMLLVPYSSCKQTDILAWMVWHFLMCFMTSPWSLVISQFSHKGAPRYSQSPWKRLFGLHKQCKHTFIPVCLFCLQ